MIEPEMAFCDLHGNMDLAEAFLKYIISDVLENVPGRTWNSSTSASTRACSTRLEAFVEQRLRAHHLHRGGRDPGEVGQDVRVSRRLGHGPASEHERYLTEEHFKSPVIVYDYPKEIKAFYMRLNDDGKTVRAMDVLVPGIGEIIGGSQREERLDVLLGERMREQQPDPKAYWWYLRPAQLRHRPARRLRPGLRALLMYVTGMGNIRDVIPFPRTPGHCEF